VTDIVRYVQREVMLGLPETLILSYRGELYLMIENQLLKLVDLGLRQRRHVEPLQVRQVRQSAPPARKSRGLAQQVPEKGDSENAAGGNAELSKLAVAAAR
jgi:hypothetical protein